MFYVQFSIHCLIFLFGLSLEQATGTEMSRPLCFCIARQTLNPINERKKRC